jgi:hypothetical protein
VESLILIDVLIAAAACGLWYACFAHHNRNKGAKVLRWVEAACGHRGRITEQHWEGSSHLQARLAFAAHWFENARVTVQLRPRPLPLRWLYSLWRRECETLTFEADLDSAPEFQLQVFRHRWLTHNHTHADAGKRNWELHRSGPVLLTTRSEWTEELNPVVKTLMTSKGHNLLSVRFREESPHLAATLPLEALGDTQAASSFLKVLRALAEGASLHSR